MTLSTQEKKVTHLVQQIVEPGKELYVVDVEVTGAKNVSLWVYMESFAGGVTLDQCAKISRELSVLLDAHGIFEGAYRLNVSSPGLDRPLKHLQQYKTNIGRMAKVTVLELDKKTVLKGKLTSVDEKHFTLDVDGVLHTIAFEKNYETKIIPSF